MIKKPINITYEVLIYIVYFVAVLLGQRLALMKPDITDLLWSYGLWVSYFLLLISISYRSFSKERGVVVSSSSLYGLIVGAFLWTLYILNELNSEHHAFDYMMLVGIILFAVLVSFISATVALFLATIIRHIHKTPGGRCC